MKKIGMLTSGGDCQALNAAMRGVVKALAHNVDELEIYGFENGYKGLIYENYRILTSKDFSGILTKGGTILGSSRQPFKLMRVPDENGLDKVAAMKNTYKKEPSPRRMQPFPKRNTRRSLQRANTRQYHTRLQTASAKDSVLRSEWQCRDIHSEAAVHVLTTECFVHVLAQQQQRPSWMRIMAA